MNNLTNWLFVFIGGGAGSLLRYGASSLLNQNYPYGTFLANVLGCLLIGFFIGLYEKSILAEQYLYLLSIGFCGGFTTFSSFALENTSMLREGNYVAFFTYLFGSILVGFLMVFIGLRIGKGLL